MSPEDSSELALSVAETMRVMWLAFGAVVGGAMGSFGNVVIHRMPRHQSVVTPPSHCPHCGVPIAPWNNIPVVSWLALRGKARCCGGPISRRYFWGELVGAVLGFLVV